MAPRLGQRDGLDGKAAERGGRAAPGDRWRGAPRCGDASLSGSRRGRSSSRSAGGRGSVRRRLIAAEAHDQCLKVHSDPAKEVVTLRFADAPDDLG